jgi:hypothetical protein
VKERLITNLESIFASDGGVRFEVIVVDNASADGSVEMVRHKFPQVHLVTNCDNLGFAKACNQGIVMSSGRYALLLNPDMRIFSDTLSKLVSWLDKNPQAIVCGGKLVDEKGKIVPHVRRFPRLSDQLVVTLKLGKIFPRLLDRYLCSDFNYTKMSPVDSIRGSFFCINKFEFGKISGSHLPLLDEGYFIWFEEVDFCRQIKDMGGQVWYYPGAKALDYVGASFSQVNLRRKQGYFRSSMLRYFGKWNSGWEKAVLYLAWVVSDLAIMVISIWKRK